MGRINGNIIFIIILGKKINYKWISICGYSKLCILVGWKVKPFEPNVSWANGFGLGPYVL